MNIKNLALAFFLLLCNAYAQDIYVGGENTNKPFNYLNEKGEASGFDNEVVKIVTSYIPNAKVHFVTLPWNSIIAGLDSNKFQVVANQIAKTKERQSKYLFSAKPYTQGIATLIVGAGSKANSFKDLKGAKIGVAMGSNYALSLEKYAQDHPELKLKIVYYKNTQTLLADLGNARIEAMINNPAVALAYAKAQGINIKPTQEILHKTPVYFIFRKDSKALKEEFDIALEKALQEGRISKLSIEYFGTDYTK